MSLGTYYKECLRWLWVEVRDNLAEPNAGAMHPSAQEALATEFYTYWHSKNELNRAI